MQSLSADDLLIIIVTLFVMGLLGVAWKSSQGYFRVSGGGEKRFDRMFFWVALAIVITLCLKLNVNEMEYWLWRIKKLWRF